MQFRERAAALSQMLSVPHGFTLSVSGTLAIAVHQHGYPGDVAIWWFVVAGGAAFCVAVLLSGAAVRENRGDRPRGASLLNLTPVAVVPVAVLSGTRIGQADLRMAVTGFVCVAAYLALLAATTRFETVRTED